MCDYEKSALRQAFFPEYLETLFAAIKKSSVKIDHIFVTGDISHQSNSNVYPHAKTLLNYISKELSVKKENIYVVNGNHDICRTTGSKSAYDNFANEYGNRSNIIGTGLRFIFFKESNQGILCFDSIGSEFKTGFPAPFTRKEKDDLVTLARDNHLENIYVLSHHPPESYDVQNQAPFDEDNNEWSSKHIWYDGGNLYRRLASRTTINGNVFWFSGDIHRPDYCFIDETRILIVTGSLNAEEEVTSSVPPQARIVSTEDIGCSFVYEYNFSGHNRRGLEGAWREKEVPVRSFNTLERNQQLIEAESISPILASNDRSSTSPTDALSTHFSLIDIELEKETYKQVAERGLYEFGRFDTNPETTCLSWISIHTLLSSYPFFLKIINAFRKKITSLIPEGIEKQLCLLIGVDTWGSILASRLGAATNIRSCCVAVRSQGDSYDSFERINEELRAIVRRKVIAFVISDVIATGYSVIKVKSEFECVECLNWYSLAIFCDPTQKRNLDSSGYRNTFYICGSVKMPIIKSSMLPNSDILKADISFVR